VPKHVGVLPDGNRRFARFAEMKSVDEGHRTGAETLSRLVQWCDDLEIPVITIWVLSTDNFERPAEELAGIFGLVEEGVDGLLEAQSKSARPRRIRSVGRRELIPPSTLAAIERIERETAEYSGGELIIAVGYGGREEIVDAVRRMLSDRIARGELLEGI